MLKLLFWMWIAVLLLGGCTTLPIDLTDPVLLAQPVARVADADNVALDKASTENCAVTQPFQDEPPKDPNADAFGFGAWHINAKRTIWVALPPDGTWGVGSAKVIWIRPAGTELKVSGQRLDGESTPLKADIPCCYPTGFQVMGLIFPSGGCWEVIATAGEDELRFVTWVEDVAP